MIEYLGNNVVRCSVERAAPSAASIGEDFAQLGYCRGRRTGLLAELVSRLVNEYAT